jgi:hypothetical protein
MNSLPHEPRPPANTRQFSLRALLLVMAIIGLILATYRWDWVETHRTQTEYALYELSTTFRREWGGKMQRHGPERLSINGKLQHIRWFELDELRVRESIGANGRIVEVAHYDRNVLSGHYASGDGQAWIYEGQFKNGQPDGSWKMLFDRRLSWRSQSGTCANIHEFTGCTPMPAEPIQLLASWKIGQRQGTWTMEEWPAARNLDLANAARRSSAHRRV